MNKQKLIKWLEKRVHEEAEQSNEYNKLGIDYNIDRALSRGSCSAFTEVYNKVLNEYKLEQDKSNES